MFSNVQPQNMKHTLQRVRVLELVDFSSDDDDICCKVVLNFFFRLGGAIGAGSSGNDGDAVFGSFDIGKWIEFLVLAITSGSCKEGAALGGADFSSLWLLWCFKIGLFRLDSTPFSLNVDVDADNCSSRLSITAINIAQNNKSHLSSSCTW